MKYKYKFTNEACVFQGRKLHRIKAVMSFSDVKKGDLGGWIEKMENLNQFGNCWIYDDAKVFDNAHVYCNACIKNNAIISNDAKISGNAVVKDNAVIRDFANIDENAYIDCNVDISGNTRIYGNVIVTNEAHILGNTLIRDNCIIKGTARISGDIVLYNKITVGNYVLLDGNFSLQGDAKINDVSDFIVFKNWWSSGRYFVWTRSNNMWSVGCFYGTSEELIEKAYADSEKVGKWYEYMVKFVESIKTNEYYGK